MTLSRRHFFALSAALPWALTARASTSVPVGLELYSVRDALKKDPEATVRAVAQMGYQVVEFYGPYFQWSEAQAKQMRKLMDDLGIRCLSTHNDESNLNPQNLDRARDLNLILGSKYIIQAWSDPKANLDAWKPVADRLNAAAEKLEPSGLHVGYHNHNAEFTGAKGQRPIELIAKNTKPSVVLQLDVGTCLEAGANPVEWIKANPGRIRSIHCKDWSHDPAKGYKVLFGEGDADWKGMFAAAESVGGVEYYLVEQEGSRYPELETAQKCLEAFRAAHRL
ncbi:MAG TPA: sugar phosphate isomerase/epimerase family protein [Terriglobales bacterium]|jgi:sugar phosphate isomerase/epimerase|nr:sugar phosphate isomerase/epimerase family protein [Terriglobales bacterium]